VEDVRDPVLLGFPVSDDENAVHVPFERFHDAMFVEERAYGRAKKLGAALIAITELMKQHQVL
jgi:hypothetical protein